MCKNGLNESHLKDSLYMCHESLSLSASWLHRAGHVAGEGHLEIEDAPKLEQAEELLARAIELIHEVEHSLAGDDHSHDNTHNHEHGSDHGHSHGTGFVVELV